MMQTIFKIGDIVEIVDKNYVWYGVVGRVVSVDNIKDGHEPMVEIKNFFPDNSSFAPTYNIWALTHRLER